MVVKCFPKKKKKDEFEAKGLRAVIAKVGFRREGPCDGFSDSNPSWPPLLSTLRGRFQTTIQSQMARTWRREFRPEHAFVRIKMLFLERVTTSSREHAKDEI